MGRLATRSEGSGLEVRDEGQPFDVLKELTRHGYVTADSDPQGAGILLRHDHAPDLVLHADGRLELPAGQARKTSPAGLVRNIRRMSWGRTFMIVVLAALVWFLAVFLTVAFLTGDF